MALIEEGLTDFFRANPSIGAIIGTGKQSKFFPLRMPHDVAVPAITYQKISGPREVSHCGDSGLARPRFQFSCWSKDYISGKRLAKEVVRAFSGFSGFVGAVEVSAEVDLELDLVDDETNLFNTVVDVTFWEKETQT